MTQPSKRLDLYLHEKIPGLSRTRIQQAIRERVTLSWDVTARPSTPVRPGGEVHIGYTPLAEELLDDACIVVSLLLQNGADPAQLAASMGRLDG